MNKLTIEKRVQIINLLVEGNSLRSCSRIADVSITTVSKLFVAVGKACAEFHNSTVIGVSSKHVQCDEIWSFVHKKEKRVPKIERGNGVGDVWTWVAIDADSKLVISWFVGGRNLESAKEFMYDLSGRLKSKVQLTTDGFTAYPEAVRINFDEVDYCRQDKIYGKGINKEGKVDNRVRYLKSERKVVFGNPDIKYITTNHIERQNLTMRMNMRRFTRDTNAFSKKIENHCYAIALHFVYYNFVRIHKSLRVTPAMEAGLTKRFMSIKEIVNLADNSN